MLLALAAVVVGAAAQTVAGFGFALVCAPALVALLGPGAAVRTVITLSCVISALVLVRARRHARWRDAVLLAVPGMVLAVPLAAAVHRANARVLTVAAGLVTLLAVAALVRDLRPRWLGGTLGAGVVGAVSAAMNALGGLSGPAAALYAVHRRWPPPAVTATLQVFGLLLNAATLTTLGGPTLDWRLCAALPVGWAAGTALSRRLDAAATRRVVLAVATAGAMAAVARGLTG